MAYLVQYLTSRCSSSILESPSVQRSTVGGVSHQDASVVRLAFLSERFWTSLVTTVACSVAMLLVSRVFLKLLSAQSALASALSCSWRRAATLYG